MFPASYRESWGAQLPLAKREVMAVLRPVRVLAGRSLLDPNVTSQALQWLRNLSLPVPRSKLDLLSPQEQRILPWIAEGKTNKEIAVSLNLSDKTVKNYIANMYQKLHITRRTEAAAFFTRHSKP